MGTREKDVPQFGGNRQWYEDEVPRRKVTLPDYRIARVPTTNAQYLLFVQATGHRSPKHWEENRPPKGKEGHPVVRVSWHDAMAYCDWLSQVTGQRITLPSEAEWEKAARGDGDAREFPWGDTFDVTRCNSGDLGLGDTTPVGIFLEVASPYGLLDLSGNVLEWTRSVYKSYPYDPRDGRENPEGGSARVGRGGSFHSNQRHVRCASRFRPAPGRVHFSVGFRVMVAPG